MGSVMSMKRYTATAVWVFVGIFCLTGLANAQSLAGLWDATVVVNGVVTWTADGGYVEGARGGAIATR